MSSEIVARIRAYTETDHTAAMLRTLAEIRALPEAKED